MRIKDYFIVFVALIFGLTPQPAFSETENDNPYRHHYAVPPDFKASMKPIDAFFEYYDPLKAGISMEEVNTGRSENRPIWRNQQKLGIALFGSMDLKQFYALNPTLDDRIRLLEWVLQFPRGQLHEPPSREVVLGFLERVLHDAFEVVSNIEEWLRIASYRVMGAAQFESQRTRAILNRLPQFIVFNPTDSQIRKLLTITGIWGSEFYTLNLYLEQVSVDDDERKKQHVLLNLITGDDKRDSWNRPQHREILLQLLYVKLQASNHTALTEEEVTKLKIVLSKQIKGFGMRIQRIEMGDGTSRFRVSFYPEGKSIFDRLSLLIQWLKSICGRR